MERRRVVITGIGAITPIGLGVEGLWHGLLRRESAIRCITRFDPTMFKSRIAGEVGDFFPGDHIEERRVRRLDRFSQFSVAASRMALADAELDLARENPDRIGAMMGTALGGVAHGESQYHNFLTAGPRAVDPALALTVFAGAASCNIAIEFGCTGPNSTNGMSCASGAIAIGEGFRAIARGEADIMLTGGAEAPLAPLCFGAFAIIRAMSTRNDEPAKASRPWDRDRDGFVLSDGAGVLVIEELEHAKARGARIYCELAGFGMSGDAFHMTSPPEDGDGARRSMTVALADAKVNPEEVGYVNAHATSTGVGDIAEVHAIKSCFGEHAMKLPVSSTKSMTGHLLGAAGGVEAIFSILAMRDGVIPPTINLDNPGEGCDLDFVPHTAREAKLDIVLSNSFGFGGTNGTLVFRRI